MKRVLLIPIIAGALVLPGLFLLSQTVRDSSSVASGPSTEPEVEAPEVVDNWEQETKIEEQQEVAANEAVLADPEVAKAIAGAYSYQVDFKLEKDNTNEVTIKIVGMESVVGTWNTSYTQTYSNLKTFVMQVDERTNEIVHRMSFTPDNQVYSASLYTAEKRNVKVALENEEVKNALAGLQDGKDYYVRAFSQGGYGAGSGIDCPMGSCSTLYITLVNTKDVITIDFNRSTHEVAKVYIPPDWRS